MTEAMGSPGRREQLAEIALGGRVRHDGKRGASVSWFVNFVPPARQVHLSEPGQLDADRRGIHEFVGATEIRCSPNMVCANDHFFALVQRSVEVDIECGAEPAGPTCSPIAAPPTMAIVERHGPRDRTVAGRRVPCRSGRWGLLLADRDEQVGSSLDAQ